MADIRIRIMLNKGRIGIPLEKLGNIAEETQKFFKLLCRDIGIPINKGDWIASNFENGSVAYDIKYIGEYETKQATKFNKGMLSIVSLEPESLPKEKWISNETILQYANIAKPIDADEQIDFGIYRSRAKKPKEWKTLTKEHAGTIIKLVHSTVEYYGAVNGIIHALFKGAQPPHFTLRDSLTGELIKCTYKGSLYKDIVAALERNDAIVNAFGFIRANAISRKIEGVDVSNIKAAPALTEDDYNEFFGCAPDITCDHLYDE